MTQWFDPEPTFKGLLFARELVACGFEVEVITGFPNYPGGTLYDGYRIKLIQKETIGTIEVAEMIGQFQDLRKSSTVKRALLKKVDLEINFRL